MKTLKENFFNNDTLAINPLAEAAPKAKLKPNYPHLQVERVYIVEKDGPKGSIKLGIFTDMKQALDAKAQAGDPSIVVVQYPVGVMNGDVESLGKIVG